MVSGILINEVMEFQVELDSVVGIDVAAHKLHFLKDGVHTGELRRPHAGTGPLGGELFNGKPQRMDFLNVGLAQGSHEGPAVRPQLYLPF